MAPATVSAFQVYAASVTPCDANLEIDHARLAAHIRWLLTNGCTGVAFMGTTGEANSFSSSQRMQALEELLAADIDPYQVMVGTGCSALNETIRLTRHALSCGVREVLMLPPFYYKEVTDDGIVTYFEKVLQAVGASGLRVYLYHFPHMSRVPFSDASVARLLALYPGTIAGMKDSSGDWAHMEHVIRRFPGFRLFAGTERHLLKVLHTGGAGCITATANVLCTLAARLVAHQTSASASRLQAQLTRARSAIEGYPMVAAVKELLARRTGDASWRHMIPPNVPLTPDTAAILWQGYTQCGV
ncbi:MAG: dihydrodipicolinate synthase family protein [Bacteroidota bacterium]|nr:dihydrodipicolinate synthase family protein [Bacteroidota bacterium]MDE2835153.1 dihydrodipicolinate synthase family protein [Bacteroidota bacterium]MDE2957771.1 dihydrodipicolinate synthase family protein [Bacteroidota bacterium]